MKGRPLLLSAVDETTPHFDEFRDTALHAFLIFLPEDERKEVLKFSENGEDDA